jgi:hypothetical protein
MATLANFTYIGLRIELDVILDMATLANFNFIGLRIELDVMLASVAWQHWP